MSAHTTSIRQTYRVTIDIEAMISAEPLETPKVNSEHLRYYQALLQSLQTHPSLLDQVLRSAAVDSLKEASKMIEAEYGWERAFKEPPRHIAIAELKSKEDAAHDTHPLFLEQACRTIGILGMTRNTSLII